MRPTGHTRLAAAARRLVPSAVPVVTHAVGPLSLLLAALRPATLSTELPWPRYFAHVGATAHGTSTREAGAPAAASRSGIRLARLRRGDRGFSAGIEMLIGFGDLSDLVERDGVLAPETYLTLASDHLGLPREPAFAGIVFAPDEASASRIAAAAERFFGGPDDLGAHADTGFHALAARLENPPPPPWDDPPVPGDIPEGARDLLAFEASFR